MAHEDEEIETIDEAIRVTAESTDVDVGDLRGRADAIEFVDTDADGDEAVHRKS